LAQADRTAAAWAPWPSAAARERRVWAASLLNLAAMAVEIVGGAATGSAALLAEGYHTGAHVLAMVLAGVGYRVGAQVQRRRGAAAGRRVGALVGLLNALLLFAVAGLLLVESIEHLRRPEAIPLAPAVALAVFGLAVTCTSLRLLHERPARNPDRSARDLNLHAVYLHLLGDAGLGVLVLVGLALVAGAHWLWADGAAGVCGAVLIAALGVQILQAVRAAGRPRR